MFVEVTGEKIPSSKPLSCMKWADPARWVDSPRWDGFYSMFIWNLVSHFSQKASCVAGKDCFDHVVFKHFLQ